jgi:indolepyruvate ferredoxin oxidoreductase alpha subunit
VELPCAESGDAGKRGYLVAGHMGAVRDGVAPTLRLGGCHPLPAARIRTFAGRLDELVVVEEGLPLLTEAVRALGLGCAVRRGELDRAAEGPPLEPARLPERPHVGDWPSFFEGALAKMRRFAPADPRRELLGRVRTLTRRTLVCADPGFSGVLGIPDGLVDVKLQMGGAAPAAGALADAGVDALPVALMGDSNFYHSELLGVLDNAIAGRDVLHVLCVNHMSEMTSRVVTPELPDAALEAMMRGAGIPVFRDLGTAAAAQGSRLLVLDAPPNFPPISV